MGQVGRIFYVILGLKRLALARVLVEAPGSQVPDGPGQDQAGDQTGGVKANEPDEELTPVPERKAFFNCSIRRLSRFVRRAISRFTSSRVILVYYGIGRFGVSAMV